MRVFLTLTAAVLSASAVPASLPAAVPIPASASGSSFTPEVMKKMLQLVAAKGLDKEASSYYTNPLGLTPSGQGWPDRQLTARDTDNLFHGFLVSRGGDQDLLLYIRNGNNVHIFRSTRACKAVAALNYDTLSKTITIRSANDSQNDLDDECDFWARGVDKLLAGE